ncbi:MAG: saccharopine dehydrogenase NADP-binding domain-containing protein [Burkholderiaceae bacterium]|jgi:homospermidine synthase|nr:saccharopine dehydrogenase NADP-binding domain-containing protein [Burkholderiaceae bacterium]
MFSYTEVTEEMDIVKTSFSGNLVIVGFGTIAQAVLPLLQEHLDMPQGNVTVVSPHANRRVIHALGIKLIDVALTPSNYEETLRPLLKKGDFLLNLSVSVSSFALIQLCAKEGALYLDTSIEPWEGGYTDVALSVADRSNYALREQVLDFGRKNRNAPTAIVCQGANPGVISALAKQGLLVMAEKCGLSVSPASREEWADLACRLNIRTIQVAEYDSQVINRNKRIGEFINTWSVDGLISESLQPAELGWGSHEKTLPLDATTHASGCQSAIMLNAPGASVHVRGWTPLGPYIGFMITHNESISIADYLTIRDGDTVRYRPTVFYAYRPSDATVLSLHEMAGHCWRTPPIQTTVSDEITSGEDVLGVLLLGNPGGALWYGSRMSVEKARRLAPYNNATSIQVAAGVLSGMLYAIEHPALGVIEPDDVDHQFMLRVAAPYLGIITGEYSDWSPVQHRNWPMAEQVDLDDPWQFSNFRAS